MALAAYLAAQRKLWNRLHRYGGPVTLRKSPRRSPTAPPPAFRNPLKDVGSPGGFAPASPDEVVIEGVYALVKPYTPPAGEGAGDSTTPGRRFVASRVLTVSPLDLVDAVGTPVRAEPDDEWLFDGGVWFAGPCKPLAPDGVTVIKYDVVIGQ